MRELVLDTETTGLDFESGHRIVEIGIIELINHVQTGNYFHYYLNPERESDVQALKIHGLTNDFLKNEPKFSDIVDELVDFISDSKIIIHNAAFDAGFLNFELRKCDKLDLDPALIVDTLILSKKKFVGQSVSLDSLCRKFNIDISNRETHGALKDAKLLAQVYLELIGGKQTKLEFSAENDFKNHDDLIFDINSLYKSNRKISTKRSFVNTEDNKLHLETIKGIPNSIWSKLKD